LFLGLVAFVAAELLCRGWLLVRGLPQSPAKIMTEIHELKVALTDSIPTPEEVAKKNGWRPDPRNKGRKDIFHPYQGCCDDVDFEKITKWRRYFMLPRHPEDYSIVVLGGSVAGIFAGGSRDYFLETIKQDPGLKHRNVRWIDCTRGGLKQPQQVCQFAYLLCAGYKPDAVINIDGFNEVAMGSFNAGHGTFPIYPSITHWGLLAHSGMMEPKVLKTLVSMRELRQDAESIASTALGCGLHYNGILGYMTIFRLKSIKQEYGKANDRYIGWLSEPSMNADSSALKGPEFVEDSEYVFGLLVSSWSEASQSISAMCKARGIHYIHVLQPNLHDKGSKPVTEEEAIKGVTNPFWKGGVEIGYPLLRKEGEKLRARGVPFYDLSMVFKDLHETVYYDSCHFKGKGLRLFGLAVGKAFLDALPDD